MARVAIQGDGVAARCCEYLLRRAGHEVSSAFAGRERLPAIMLSGAAMALIEDVFGRPGIFAGIHRIHRRVVAWGGEPVALEHSAGVVSERQLLALLPDAKEMRPDAQDWTIVSSRPLPAGTEEHRFGSRTARARRAVLAGSGETCWIEALERGWLFLIPDGEREGWLLAVGAAPEELLAGSRLIAAQIAELGAEGRDFAAHPRIVAPLCGTGWIACGSAAMAFDPICGDGTANAVREAILAAATIGAGEGALAHYEGRLIAGFEKHLALCANYYRTGGRGDWWAREFDALREGLAWCKQRADGLTGDRYQLRGFDLVKLT
jgi:hypothetical protein